MNALAITTTTGDGNVEAKAEGVAGDWVVLNPDGELYRIAETEFATIYVPAS